MKRGHVHIKCQDVHVNFLYEFFHIFKYAFRINGAYAPEIKNAFPFLGVELYHHIHIYMPTSIAY
jgi:hypothetical protein